MKEVNSILIHSFEGVLIGWVAEVTLLTLITRKKPWTAVVPNYTHGFKLKRFKTYLEADEWVEKEGQ